MKKKSMYRFNIHIHNKHLFIKKKMSSYCPICDQFVDNLDTCDLPYGGNPAPNYNQEMLPPNTVNWSEDEMEEAEMISEVSHDGVNYEIDFDSKDVGLYRLNAMTYYHELTPYLVLATDVQTSEKLFYLVKCKNYSRVWIQVDLDIGIKINQKM